ncbi:PAS domain-containing protein [Herbaspirillum frisingense]|uniref:methyl-accepting chemotaxis protein n=1 Tax=Herbaspirillum frisingense TaxID=92645 RepID=UPI0016016D50|nr:PAS domain-containing methyl-accepting chemotaxis protein [Herbaspirillum frisingense]QNB08868.1 PAS domain-containing protein [Herbaspirillum frisingense]
MRLNLPVTQQERDIDAHASIVSKTDTKGRITYVNPTFITVSGFTEEELIGAPQNIVRHPDMPELAFADLWSTLKAGLPWTGLVKNRCKNGDFYWVKANVTPIWERGVCSGYMSVRTKPSRAEVNAAEGAYKELKKESARIAVYRGEVVPTGLRGTVQRAARVSLKTRLDLGLGTAAIGVGALAFFNAQCLGQASSLPTLAASGVALASLALLRMTLVARIFTPLRQAVAQSRRVAGGDLSASDLQARRDEMGALLQAMEQMRVNLVASVGDVRRSGVHMAQATSEIARGNMDLSSRTESQASSLEETAASMEELASTVTKNSENARQANRLVEEALVTTRTGEASIRHINETMDAINKSADQIKQITGLIDGIAFQTNILALNAAVEAARAGEQGRGFAVVAGEVRTLAQRSTQATKEIKALIDESSQRVGAGVKLADEMRDTMDGIMRSVTQAATAVAEITAASGEQQTGIQQVNEAVVMMDEVTQRNAALVEEAAAAATSLEESTQQMIQAISVFNLDAAVASAPGAASGMTRAQPGLPSRGTAKALAMHRTA